jgi:hypothetical protein
VAPSTSATVAALAAVGGGTPPEGYEVKVLVEPADFPQLLTALGWLNEDLRRRDVWFVDTADLDLLNAGVILRARQEEDDLDLTVKLRGVTDFAPFAGVVPDDDVKSEVDVMGSRATGSVSYTRDRSADFDPDDPLARFSNRQLRFLRDLGGVDLASLPSPLRAVGPVRTIKREHPVPGLADELVLEHWTLPDGSILVELSAMADDAAAAVALKTRLEAFLQAAGAAQAPPSSKTRRALGAPAATPATSSTATGAGAGGSSTSSP